MNKKSGMIASFIAMLLLAGFLIAGKSKPVVNEPVKNETACTSINKPECVKKQNNSAPGEMVIESLSRQFMVIPSFYY